jgi:ElaB/YqjD/DUF883 family membrane-anchored ribosome-binding protein
MAVQQDLNTISKDLSALKRDFANLLYDLRSGPLTSAKNAAQDRAEQLSGRAADLYGQASGRASDLYGQASDQANKGADMVAQQVGDRPLVTLLMAFSVGFIASRLLPR